MQHFLPAHFCRGGTSKGLFFRDHAFAKISQATRNRIILSAMGNPDPDGRQIDGMGGGISSLSKTVIVHAPGADHPPPDSPDAFPGVPWANNLAKAHDDKTGWDVVYRFCQVGVRERGLDWGSTCGNLVAAAAMTAVNWNLVQNKSILGELMAQAPGSQATLPLRILAANSGLVVTAQLPVMLNPTFTGPTFMPVTGGDAVIAGVPGTGAPVQIETPIRNAPLRTGNPRDTLTLDDGTQIECTIVDTGLPVIFVSASRILSLSTSSHTLSTDPATLDTDLRLMILLERVRRAGADHAGILLSSSAPKICLVGPTEGDEKADMTIRAVSVGNVHRTVPATTLSALATAAAIPGTIIREASSSHVHAPPPAIGDVVSLTIAHPAGTASASVKIDQVDGIIRPQAIVYTRTARLLFSGQVAVPETVFTSP
ncbi:DUF453-domain-containing protein [Ceratobasidium sp. AG-I]|nr:DUF453-domain-containing protein [Ceratobasidium sp. AG-I]